MFIGSMNSSVNENSNSFLQFISKHAIAQRIFGISKDPNDPLFLVK